MTAWGSITELLGDDLDDIEFLGRGSSGSVYRATQRSLGRTVAVKVFRRFADDETNRVVSEARAQAALSWHANVVSLYSQGVTPDGFPYLIMEYAPGGSLADRVADCGPMAQADWRRMGAEVASALAAAHDAGVIHCDVKPSNILFAADGSARLADFGIAKATGMTSGTIDSIEGSLAYVPPELLDGEKPQPANDVYSLALSLLFAASSESPIDPQLPVAQVLAAIQAGAFKSASVRDIEDPELRRAIGSAVSTKASARPSTQKLAEDLENRPSSPTSGRADYPSLRNRAFLVGAGIVTAVALLGMFLAIKSKEIPPETPAFELCDEYEKYTESRRELFLVASADLEMSTSAYDVAERLLVGYPTDFAEIAAPFLEGVVELGGASGEVTKAQLTSMAQADNLRALGGGKPFLYDGEIGAFDPAAMPVELHLPAKLISDANRYAGERCPAVTPDLQAAKARMNSAVFSNLLDPNFMDSFFGDPRSGDLWDSRTAMLIVAFAWDFFEGLLEDRWPWFFDVLDQNEELRRVLSIERPEVLLTGAQSNQSLITYLFRDEWRNDLVSGFSRSTPAARAGMASLYPEPVKALGLADS